MIDNLFTRQVTKVRKVKNSIHHKTQLTLVKRLFSSDNYDFIGQNTEYGKTHSFIIGELDVHTFKYTMKKDYLLLFEVKGYHSQKGRLHALEQLDRAEAVVGEIATRIFKFYVSPGKIEWYKR